MPAKPGAVTTATGGAGGSASLGTAGKEAPKAKPEVDRLWVEVEGAFGCNESLLLFIYSRCQAFYISFSVVSFHQANHISLHTS